MAKGLRSKRMQRNKGLKRDVMRKVIEPKRMEALGTQHLTPKSAFLYPNDPDAVFPQHKVPNRIDFRSSAIATFQPIVRSKKFFEERKGFEQAIYMKPENVEIPDMFMGELSYSIKNIEKTMVKKAKMQMS